MKKFLLFNIDIFKFFIRPSFNRIENLNIIAKIFRTIWVFIILWFIIILFSLLPNDLLLKHSEITNYSIVIGALLEELIFRSILIFSKFNLKLFISSTIGISLLIINPINLINENRYISLFVCFISIYLLLTILIIKNPKIVNKLSFYHNKYKIIIYIVLQLSFAFLHLAPVINIEFYLILSILLFVLQKLLAGIIYSYARIKYGLLSSISLHMSFNLIIINL